MAAFNTIKKLPQALIEILNKLNFRTMTQIQEKAIAPILDNRDILAQSKTGSGKTLAFGIPCVIRTDTDHYRPQTIIITPTRELAEQIAGELRKIAAYKSNLKILTLYGGVPLRNQADSLAKGAHILIGTPGRIRDHLSKSTLKLDSIRTLVLDESDRMLDMGFYDDIVKVASNIPDTRQTLLFSATFPTKIEKLAKSLLKQPVIMKVDIMQESDKIDEIVYETSDKYSMLTALIRSFKPESLLIFCNTKEKVISLAARLHRDGHSVIDIHGDLDQRRRSESVIAFSNGSKRILVATDIASRGLDIKNIELVVNYDLPFDKEVYIHRIGRTGRSDSKGRAITLYSPDEEEKCTSITSHSHKGRMEDINADNSFVMVSDYGTLCINGGKKTKLRAGDILGTFCKEIGIDNSMIGKITITDTNTYIALHHTVLSEVLNALKSVKIKKKKYIAWILD